MRAEAQRAQRRFAPLPRLAFARASTHSSRLRGDLATAAKPQRPLRLCASKLFFSASPRLRVNILLALALTAITPAAQAAPPEAPVAKAPTRHVTQTYLRAARGKRAALIAYIERNWFAMDRIGIQQGLFTSYALLERADDSEADWDVIVAVGYPTPQGHDAPGVAEAFKKIRAAHREVKIDGQGLAQLGTIVRHHPLTLVQQGS